MKKAPRIPPATIPPIAPLEMVPTVSDLKSGAIPLETELEVGLAVSVGVAFKLAALLVVELGLEVAVADDDIVVTMVSVVGTTDGAVYTVDVMLLITVGGRGS